MKKVTLEEQQTRIKSMMGLNEGEVYKSGAEEHQEYLDSLKTPEGAIEYLKKMSEKVEYIAEDMAVKFEDTVFWHHIGPLYKAIKSVSDMEGFHTRTDRRNENVSYAIEHITHDHAEDEEEYDDEPTDDQMMNQGNYEGGIKYGKGDEWQGR
jgi:hypothetical protein